MFIYSKCFSCYCIVVIEKLILELELSNIQFREIKLFHDIIVANILVSKNISKIYFSLENNHVIKICVEKIIKIVWFYGKLFHYHRSNVSSSTKFVSNVLGNFHSFGTNFGVV